MERYRIEELQPPGPAFDACHWRLIYATRMENDAYGAWEVLKYKTDLAIRLRRTDGLILERKDRERPLPVLDRSLIQMQIV